MPAVGSAGRKLGSFQSLLKYTFSPKGLGSGMGFALDGAGTCWEGLFTLLRWGLDLLDLLELCQRLMFLFRGLGCRDVSLVVPPVWLTLGRDLGLGWDLPHPVHTPLKPIINLLLKVQEGAGCDLPVGRERSSP